MNRSCPDYIQAVLQGPSGSQDGRSGGSDSTLLTRCGQTLARFGHAAGSLLYPPHCISCGVPLAVNGNGVLCLLCADQIDWIGYDRCKRCGDQVGTGRGAVAECPACKSRPPAYIDGGVAVARYGGPLRAVILGLKFGRDLRAGVLLGRLVQERLKACGSEGDVDERVLLVPVPLARRDFAQRGFNQAEEIATEVARAFGCRVERELLRKTRSTPPQATLERERRRSNLQGVFEVDQARAKKVGPRKIFLVDDVITTGSTVSECARVLRSAGACGIHAISVARG